MKKIISLIFCVAMLVLALVSCGGEECTHEYNRDEWKSDATGHWYAAKCECEDAGVASKAAHVDESIVDGFCDICGYQTCTVNTYSGKYLDYKTATKHFEIPTCGHVASTSHIGVKAGDHRYDGEGGSVCLDCGYECLGIYSEWKTDARKHWKELTCEGHAHANTVIEEAAHRYAEGSLKCLDCGYECKGVYTTTEYSKDAYGHWYEREDGTCNHENHAQGSYENHLYATGSNVCSTCGYTCVGEAYKEEWSSDSENHWHEFDCKHDHGEPVKEGHTDSDFDLKCDECGYRLEDR